MYEDPYEPRLLHTGINFRIPSPHAYRIDGPQNHYRNPGILTPLEKNKIKKYKVTLQADKTAHEQPINSQDEKRCLATYVNVRGHEV